MKRALLLIGLLISAFLLIACSNTSVTPTVTTFKMTAGVSKSTAKLDDKNYINLKGTAPKGVKFIEVVYDDTIIDTITVKNNEFSYHNNGAGGPFKLKFITSKSKIDIGGNPNEIHGQTITLEVPKSPASSNSESNTQSSSNTPDLSFGTAQQLGTEDGSEIATVTIMTAKKISDPNEGLTADLMENYPELKQFAIVSYKVEAKTDVPKDDFDGANLTFLDANKTSGTVSSNRDPGSDSDLKAGESRIYRIGVGFYSTDTTIYVRIGNVTWKGNIQ